MSASGNYRPVKSYKNLEFLNSDHARLIRITCELEEPKYRLRDIDNVIMVFGSARALSREEYETLLKKLEGELQNATGPALEKAKLEIKTLKAKEIQAEAYEKVREFSRRLTEWSLLRSKSRKAEGASHAYDAEKPKKPASYYIATGGGPGLMAAANRGASEAGGKSIGFAISLPWETCVNPWITPELGFEFHYFFTRKFWMAYKMAALVIAPGGFGTCDELFEIFTLLQTQRIKKNFPIILFGKAFWNDVINWEKFVEHGMIVQADLDRMFMTDSVDDALRHMISGLEALELSTPSET